MVADTAPPGVTEEKAPRPARGGRTARRSYSDTIAGYLFILPAIVGFTLFVVYPLVRSGYLALTKWNGLTDPVFVGLGNFRRMFFDDPTFWPSMSATAYLVVLYVPLSLIIGLALAVFLNKRFAGVKLVRTICYLPVVLPVIATITLWKFVFNPQVGLANVILQALHLPPSLWVSGAKTAMPSVVLVMLWSVGSTMVIFLAALQAVPKELYEAARIDGASERQAFWRVTLPVISPIMLLQVVLQLTTALQTFNQPKILTPPEGSGGGPGFSTNVLMLSIYKNGFAPLGQVPQLGYAAAQVWILFLIIVVAVAATARFSSIWTYSEHTTD